MEGSEIEIEIGIEIGYCSNEQWGAIFSHRSSGGGHFWNLLSCYTENITNRFCSRFSSFYTVMARYFNNDLEYLEADYSHMIGFEDDGEFAQFNHQDSDSGSQQNDTTAAEYRNGKDIQGIPWERLNYSRERYRELRLKQYQNYRSLSRAPVDLDKECKEVNTGSTFYNFWSNTRLVKPTIVHFQLRNLLWATSKHDVYTVQNYSVTHWSSLLKKSNEVLNVTGSIVPTQKPQGSASQPIRRVQISTMAVKENMMVVGGFQGELILKHLNHPGVDFCTKLTDGANAITNAVDIYRSASGSLQVMAANNDCNIRIFDATNFALLKNLSFPWSVNNTSVSPDGKLFAVLGDSTECLLADTQSGKVVGSLKGHSDYSFASAWHPEGNLVATGNQDKTCRLWDVRNLSKSLAVLEGRMGAIRGIKFSSDGRFMATAEPADFVHIYDAKAGFCESQEIDLFGEIAGLSFSPDTEALFVSIADRTYGSLLEFSRRHQFHYVDSFI